ncbi:MULTISPECIES: MFS transporter [Maribellus]|uniref:MFS transporter n=1 Tax=Maribellus comscasis TaxID=2681766 RepID=A0A6I6JV33_9BACT|nr:MULTISPECIES: MFS transporter [Maribellus]MCG6186104.1 MFS transporter [Maribellus maritimus]QGY45129.1 MFS transporter [Maribellus comscasis]
MSSFVKNKQYYKFSFYGFLKNLRFFDAFFILFLVEKGLSYTEIGVLYAAREICINIFEVPSGIVADTYGRKNSLMGSFVAYILSFVVFFISANFWLFLVAFIFYGVGDAFRSGTHKGMIMEYLKIENWEDQKIDYYGHTRSWSQMGSAISSLIAGGIVFYSGEYHNIFLYSIVPYMINLFLIMSYPNALNHSSNQSEKNKKVSFVFMVKSLIKMVKRPKVLKIINTAALHSAYLKAVKDYIQPLMASVALLIPVFVNQEDEKRNGAIIGVIYFLIYLGTSRASKYSSKLEKNNKIDLPFVTLLFGFFLGTVTGFFYSCEIWVVALVAFIGIYLVENVRKPVLTGYISDNVPNEVLTSVISAQSLLKTILTSVLAFVFGVVADHFGIGISFIVVSVFLGVFSIFIYYLKGLRN